MIRCGEPELTTLGDEHDALTSDEVMLGIDRANDGIEPAPELCLRNTESHVHHFRLLSTEPTL